MLQGTFSLTGAEASRSFGADQLCGGLEAGVEVGIYFMHSPSEAHSSEKDWGVLLEGTYSVLN